MVANHYRWDFIGLSSQPKPTPQTSEKVVDGSTFYEGDTSKLYVYCRNNWYEKTVSGGGGGTSDFDQLTNRPKYNGTAMTGETDIPLVPSVYADPETQSKIQIGSSANVGTGNNNISIGNSSSVGNSINYNTAIGYNASCATSNGMISIGTNSASTARYGVCLGNSAKINNSTAECALALGSFSKPTVRGEINVSTREGGAIGYNNTMYRVIRDVHDGEQLHDAATLAQGNTLGTSAPTTSTVGVLGQLYTDTTEMHTYQCTAVSGSTYTWAQRW